MVESAHPIIQRVARGQHHHRHPVPLPPERLKHRKAVDIRQPDIQDDQCIGLVRGDHQRILAGGDMIDRVPRRAQQRDDPARQCRIILDDQNPHDAAHP
ncbi:hypothetical protein QE379_003266 [Sphingomonas sp. SORGH_AS 879]|nr:hypothetical protein [Sphingomonas sp. SORGH_AS_0879]